MEDWYTELSIVKEFVLSQDPALQHVFDTVDASNFKLHEVIKQPYPALVGAIIGQKIRYTAAKQLRSQLYSLYGTNFTPEMLYRKDLSFLGATPATIIGNVTDYILKHNVDISTEAGIRSLTAVPGIGQWTVETTILTSLMNWNIFPSGDAFIKARMIRLYGKDYNEAEIVSRWNPYKSLVTWYLWRWF